MGTHGFAAGLPEDGHTSKGPGQRRRRPGRMLT